MNKKNSNERLLTDDEIAGRIADFQREITRLLAVSGRQAQQNYEKLWVARSELANLELMQNNQIKARKMWAGVETRRLLAEKETVRANLSKQNHLAKAGARMQHMSMRAKVTAEPTKESIAQQLITQWSLSLCNQCSDGTTEVECPDCLGLGLGPQRAVDVPVNSSCPDFRSNCKHCGGTGVFSTLLRKIVTECKLCRGTGITNVTCSACRGRRVVNTAGLAFDESEEMRQRIIKLLENLSRS